MTESKNTQRKKTTELKREIDNSKETQQTYQPKAMHVPELGPD